MLIIVNNDSEFYCGNKHFEESNRSQYKWPSFAKLKFGPVLELLLTEVRDISAGQ